MSTIAFVLTGFEATMTTLSALIITGDYTPPTAYDLPTITCAMPAASFNNRLFQVELDDSEIANLHDAGAPGGVVLSEAVYLSEKMKFYGDKDKFPVLTNSANPSVLLEDLPVVNGSAPAATVIHQRPGAANASLGYSIPHELAYQATGLSLMNDQLQNDGAIHDEVDIFLNLTLPAHIKAIIQNADGKTQNIDIGTDDDSDLNVMREIVFQMVESSIGDRNTGQNSNNDRLLDLFKSANAVAGKYAITFIAGDSLRFKLTINPHADVIDHLHDGATTQSQEARSVEVILQLE